MLQVGSLHGLRATDANDTHAVAPDGHGADLHLGANAAQRFRAGAALTLSG